MKITERFLLENNFRIVYQPEKGDYKSFLKDTLPFRLYIDLFNNKLDSCYIEYEGMFLSDLMITNQEEYLDFIKVFP